MRLLLAVILIVSSCGLFAPTSWPLRGTAAGPLEVQRRPMVVKVANDAAARPQAGLAAADVVFEVPVEGGITRYSLVFHSEEPSRVGPVRSTRSSDVELVAALRAILVHVGASTTVAQEVAAAASGGAFVDVDELLMPGAFERVRDRIAPHNAFTSAELIRDAAGERGGERVRVPALQFGEVDAEVAADAAAGTSLLIPFGDPPQVRYQYDAALGAYRRLQGGQPTVDAALGLEVLPENVVVIHTDVSEIPGTADVTGAPSLRYRATGSGPVIVLRDGMRFDGTWSRGDGQMYRFADATGHVILLKPGLTWIHVVPLTLPISE